MLLNFMKKLFLILLFFSFPPLLMAQNSSPLLDNLPKDVFQIREIANELYVKQDYDLAIQVFLKGRKILNNEQLFNFELISLYRFKRDKAGLVQEYLNTVSAMPQMLQQAENVFSSIFEGNADYLLLQTALLKRMQKDPENESYAKLLTWQYLQMKEYDLALRQLIAQDKRIKDNGSILFDYTQIFIANKAYDAAIKAYTYLLLKGKENEFYLPSKLGMTEVKYQLLLNGNVYEKEIIAIAAAYQGIVDEYGTNARTLFALRRMSLIQSQYLHQAQKAEELLETALKIPGIPQQQIGEMKLELGDVYVLTGKPWDAILMYGQVTKEFENQNISNEAQYRSARLSFYQGNFSYAKSQADVLKASTTQLVANDALNLSLMLSDHLESKQDTLALMMYAEAEFFQFKNMLPAALRKLDSITIAYPKNNLNDEVLMAKSKIYLKKREFTIAATLLKQLIDHPQNNIWTDDALYTLASLYEEELHDPEQAKTLYQRLITDFPGSMFTADARRHFRKIVG